MKIKEIFETTSAGGIAAIAMPMGGVQKRKNPSIYTEEETTFKYTPPVNKDDYIAKKKVLNDMLLDPSSDPELLAIVKQYIIRLNDEAESLGYR